MDYKYLAELLFPDVTDTPEDLEIKYPKRNLPDDAKVTRFAPSPTGFIHLGGIFGATIDERLAHQSKGVFYLRIEDTDAKREIPGAAEELIKVLAEYGLEFDEGASIGDGGSIVDKGNYGPYKQSQRKPIYQVYAKKLVSEGKAYPVFMTKDDLDELNAKDKKAEVKSKVWTDEENENRFTEQKKNREFTIEEVEEHLKNGDKFTLRILADGDGEKKIKANDLVRGLIEMPENEEDFVLLKNDGIPTYHFAHAVDDHLMGTTHVIRGEEWLPSLPKHVQLFRYLGFKLPKYLHTAQIMKLDENGNKKKLSKRDLGLDMKDYERSGYASECVCEYIMTLLNSNFDEWKLQNVEKNYKEFPFAIKKMSNSGCLLDLAKLTDVSKNLISHWTAERVYDEFSNWSSKYDEDFYSEFAKNKNYTLKILSIGRGGKKPRKDIATWNDVKPYIGFFYDPYFEIVDSIPETFNKDDIKNILTSFINGYDPSEDADTWFGNVKMIASENGFADDMKAYKADPSAYKGSIADVSMFIRLAVTGKINSPDLFTVMSILGYDRTIGRIKNYIETL